MAGFTNRTEAGLLNSLFGKTSVFGALGSAPTLWVALYTAAPNEDGTGGTEATGGGYARVSTPATSWGTATQGDPTEILNSAIVDFGQASGAWSNSANMTHFGILDASTSGNLILFGALLVPKAVAQDDPVSFAVGALSIRLD